MRLTISECASVILKVPPLTCWWRGSAQSALWISAEFSRMAKAGVSAVKALLEAEDVTFFHDLAFAAERAMEENAT